MKILLPPRYICKKMYSLFHDFYDAEKENEGRMSVDNYKLFREGVKIFCEWYELDYPSINFKRKVDNTKSLGECTEKGTLNLMYPNVFHKRNVNKNSNYSYVALVFHELGHYYLWSNAEIKALEFELKMIKRGR